ncbi:hypothetical protein [Streptomyces prunicolor]|uniref:hypothetical protein n=1 Tax=Streptomyces prunicolor TaxID=67348 RepID=UPI0003A8257C|nr:hypothetical protein [Streptomyces prunicolor]
MIELSTSTRHILGPGAVTAPGCVHAALSSHTAYGLSGSTASSATRVARHHAAAEIPAYTRAWTDHLVGADVRHTLAGACAPPLVRDLNSPLTKAKSTPWPTGQQATPAKASSKADPTTSRGGAT